jgi:hypothetical protein
MTIGVVIWGLLFAAPFVVWLLFRSGGYKRQPMDAPPGRDWVFTGERFIDPSSGVAVEVWYQPRNGERVYVRARPGQGA